MRAMRRTLKGWLTTTSCVHDSAKATTHISVASTTKSEVIKMRRGEGEGGGGEGGEGEEGEDGRRWEEHTVTVDHG